MHIQAFLPARRYASAGVATATCPSVCLSVMRRYCVKMKKTDAKFHQKILRGCPRAGASNEGGMGKFRDFLALTLLG